MIDKAGIMIELGQPIGCERFEGTNNNMSQSHYHTYYELYYLEAGERNHIMGNEMYTTTPGDFMIFSPYVMHHSFSEDNTPFKRIVLYFGDDCVNSKELLEILNQASGLYQPSSKISSSIHSLLIKLLNESGKDELLHNATMNALLNSLLITIVKNTTLSAKSETTNRIGKIIDYLEQNYTRQIRLSDISEQFYISEFYLCHEFKKYTNRTIVEYIHSLRILHAQRLITETSQNFTTIAQKTGFYSSTHFYRTFKSIVGESPSEYRKNHCKRISIDKEDSL